MHSWTPSKCSLWCLKVPPSPPKPFSGFEAAACFEFVFLHFRSPLINSYLAALHVKRSSLLCVATSRLDTDLNCILKSIAQGVGVWVRVCTPIEEFTLSNKFTATVLFIRSRFGKRSQRCVFLSSSSLFLRSPCHP